MVLEYNATRIDDGLWHRIRVTRFVQYIQLCSPGHQAGVSVSNLTGKGLRGLNSATETPAYGKFSTMLSPVIRKYKTLQKSNFGRSRSSTLDNIDIITCFGT
jgi:hypothetical protein